MTTRDITVSVTLDWAPMLTQLDALADHVRALVDAGGGDQEEGTLVTDPTDEPAVGEQVTDSTDIVWQRFEDGWRWWVVGKTDWSPYHHTWDDVQNYDPLRATTDDDRRRVCLPGRDENTPPAPQNGPQDARSADSGTSGPPEPENGAQGRIGWLLLHPGDDGRYLVREVPGGWTDSESDVLVWRTRHWPDAEFTPIRTLADDEVAVQRDDLETALRLLPEGGAGPIDPSTPFLARLRDALWRPWRLENARADDAKEMP